MRVAFYGNSYNFTLHNETISELATYGVITKGQDGMCQILNPIYLHCIIQALKPLINGLEDEYFPEDSSIDFSEYIAPTGQLQMLRLIENFKDFIARAGFSILQVPDTSQEFVGQYLLFAYLDELVKVVGATMYLEVPTGRGRADLIISHSGTDSHCRNKGMAQRTQLSGRQAATRNISHIGRRNRRVLCGV